MTLIKLTSKDNKVFEVDLQIWKRSKLIQNLIENCGDVKEGETIPLLTVHSSVLEMVIKYATHHKDDTEQVNESNAGEITDWDADFMKVDQAQLMELILAANYMDMPDLLHLCCRTVANIIRGKATEEIRKLFNIANDFSPAEEMQIRKENDWCSEVQ